MLSDLGAPQNPIKTNLQKRCPKDVQQEPKTSSKRPQIHEKSIPDLFRGHLVRSLVKPWFWTTVQRICMVFQLLSLPWATANPLKMLLGSTSKMCMEKSSSKVHFYPNMIPRVLQNDTSDWWKIGLGRPKDPDGDLKVTQRSSEAPQGPSRTSKITLQDLKNDTTM